jgi:hypothetical protein
MYPTPCKVKKILSLQYNASGRENIKTNKSEAMPETLTNISGTKKLIINLKKLKQ